MSGSSGAAKKLSPKRTALNMIMIMIIMIMIIIIVCRRILANYLMWNVVVRTMVHSLPKQFVDIANDFTKVL